MPTFEYVCRKCGKKFARDMTFGEHDRKRRPPCPKCKSTSVAQQVTAFLAVTSKKS